MKKRYSSRWLRAIINSTVAITCAAAYTSPTLAADYSVTNPVTAASTLYNLTGTDSLTISNSGEVRATGGDAVQIDAAATGVTIDNSGTILSDGEGYAINSSGTATGTSITNQTGALISAPTTAIYYSGDLDGTLNNEGTIEVTATGSDSTSVTAYGIALGNDLAASGQITNSGTLEVTAAGDYETYAYGIRVGGNVAGSITNTSTDSITVNATDTYDTAIAYGIRIDNNLEQTGEILNTGTIEATAAAPDDATAYGVYVGGEGGFTGTLRNEGTISATGNASTSDAEAYGMYPNNVGTSGQIFNTGSIEATATAPNNATAYGVYVGGEGGLAGTLRNEGTISATANTSTSSAEAYGMYLNSVGTSGQIFNTGTIEATVAGVDEASACGIYVSGDFAGALTNNGTISADATVNLWAGAYGVYVSGDLAAGASLINTSDETISATASNSGSSSYASAYGLHTADLGENASIANSGTISAQATGYSWAGAYGITTDSLDLDASINNSGTISAVAIDSNSSSYSSATAMGIGVESMADGTSIANSGTITAQATAVAEADTYGIATGSTAAGATIDNSGTITVQTTVTGQPAAPAGGGRITHAIPADISESSPASSAYGIYVDGTLEATATITNSGTVTATALDPSMGYSIFVDDGTGTVTNTGTLNGNISLGGTVDMDNSGTLSIPAGVTGTIAGDYTQAANGKLQIGAAATDNYGQLEVDGTATFAAGSGIDVDVAGVHTLAVNDSLGNVVSATTLEATTFGVTDNSALFDFTAEVDGNTVDLGIVASKKTSIFESLKKAKRTMGRAAAKALDKFIDGDDRGNADMDDVITAFGKLGTEKEVADALQQTLPQYSEGASQGSKSAQQGTKRVVKSRLKATRGKSSGDGYFQGDKKVWMKPFGSWAEQDLHDGVPGFDSDTYGLVVGADGETSDTSRLGAAFSFSKVDVEGSSVVAPQNMDVKSYQLVAYGLSNYDDRTDIDFQAGVGYNNNEGSRTINFGGLTRVAESDYDSWNFTVGGGVSRDYTINEKSIITPSVRADYSWVKNKDYTETGAGALNLNVEDNTTDELIIGVDGTYEYTLSDTVSFDANIGVGYDFLAEEALITSSFAGGGGAFTTEGLDPSPWIISGGFGLTMYQIKDMEITAHYDIDTREDYSNQSASFMFRMSF